MRLDINLATQPYEDPRRFWFRWGMALIGLTLVTAVLLFTALVGLQSAIRDHAIMRQYQAQIAARDNEKQSAEARLNAPQNRVIHDRSQFLNELFQRKSFSWTKVFEDLERVMPPRLHLVSIRPEMTEDNQLQIKLVVAGESRDRAIELVRKMEDSQHFRQTQIEQETSAGGQNFGDNVQFEITAYYAPQAESAARQGGGQ